MSQKNEVKFNPTSPQTVFLEVSRGSKRYKVEHRLNPLSDADFARLNNVASISVENGEESAEIEKAVNEIWEEKIIQVKGYASSENWKSAIPLDDRRAALRGLDTGRILTETAEEDELVPLDDRCEYKLRVVFDGQPIVTRHFLRTASAEQEKRRNKVVKECSGTVGKAGELVSRMAKIYDELVLSVEGYEGTPPSNHKFIVVESHLRQQAATTEKN